MKLVGQNFWTRVYILKMVSTTFEFTGKQQNNLHIRHRKIPYRYKRNIILGDLHRSNHISSSFGEEIRFIFHKYEKADYPKRFTNNVIRQFPDRSNQSNIDDFDDYIIPPNFFDKPKSFNRITIL